MKKRLFLLIPSLLALSSCQKEEKETTYKEALSMLKKIDREINYTPLTNIPKSYTLKETVSSYQDEDKVIQDVTIDREIDQNSHYSFVRIKGKYGNKLYFHENWTYVNKDKNVTCNYLNYEEDGKLVNKRYREESKRNLKSWETFASKDIKEMQRLYAQMAKEFYVSISSMDGEIVSGEYYSDSVGSLKISVSNEKESYSCEFQNYWFTSGYSENKEKGT
ncbi:MAG TPA: hypothetical protein DD384_01490, partial [Firmicutes bacterium]|nr:hypothetical protein [Bacillota bacterium]